MWVCSFSITELQPKPVEESVAAQIPTSVSIFDNFSTFYNSFQMWVCSFSITELQAKSVEESVAAHITTSVSIWQFQYFL